jgi:hypothetical protein
VEGRIEARHLRNVRVCAPDGLDYADRLWQMLCIEGHERAEIVEHRAGDQGWFAVSAASLHHPLPNRAQTFVQALASEPGEKGLQGSGVVRYCVRTVEEYGALRIDNTETAIGAPDPFGGYSNFDRLDLAETV